MINVELKLLLKLAYLLIKANKRIFWENYFVELASYIRANTTVVYHAIGHPLRY